VPEYVNVPVRSDLVDDVMKFIADRIAGVIPKTPLTLASEPGNPAVTEESREWTREQLELLVDSNAKSIKLFVEVLDVLVTGPREGMSLDDVSKVIGIPALSIQHSFGRATVWIRNHVEGDRRWPIYWPGDDKWALSDNNFELWKAIRG
jgi:hypothetical protein